MSGMSDRLRQARVKAGYITAKEASEAMGVVYATYVGHENGSRGFFDDVARYARFFKVNAEWILTGRGDMKGDDIASTFQQLSPDAQRQAREYLDFLKSREPS